MHSNMQESKETLDWQFQREIIEEKYTNQQQNH